MSSGLVPIARAESVRSKMSRRRPASKSAQARSKKPDMANLSLTHLSTAAKPLRTKSRSRYSVSSKSNTMTETMYDSGARSAEYGRVIAQHRDALAPVIVGGERQSRSFFQEPPREARSRRVRQRKATSKSGIDLEHIDAVITGDRLEAKRSPRTGKHLREPVGDPLQSRVAAGRPLRDFAGAHFLPYMRNGAGQALLAIEEHVHGVLLSGHVLLNDIILSEFGTSHSFRASHNHRTSGGAADSWLQYQRPLPVRRLKDLIVEGSRTRDGNPSGGQKMGSLQLVARQSHYFRR